MRSKRFAPPPIKGICFVVNPINSAAVKYCLPGQLMFPEPERFLERPAAAFRRGLMDFYKEPGHFSSIKNDQKREGLKFVWLGVLRVTWGLGPWGRYIISDLPGRTFPTCLSEGRFLPGRTENGLRGLGGLGPRGLGFSVSSAIHLSSICISLDPGRTPTEP